MFNDVKWSVHESNEDREVMQFTGLLDKNGKEIYEGDIVENKYTYVEIINPEIGGPSYANVDIDEVIYDSRLAMFKLKENFECLFELDLTVIGNVYSNPELLENK